MSEALGLENACYALVLLEEICQGYDTGKYRQRFIKALRASGIRLQRGNDWFAHIYDTTKLINDLEDAIESRAPAKTDTVQPPVPR